MDYTRRIAGKRVPRPQPKRSGKLRAGLGRVMGKQPSTGLSNITGVAPEYETEVRDDTQNDCLVDPAQSCE